MRITPPPPHTHLTFVKNKSQFLGSGAYHSSGLRLAIQQSGYTFLIRYLGDISPICCRAGSLPIGWREPRSAKLRAHHYFQKTPSSVRGITLGRLATLLHTSPLTGSGTRCPFCLQPYHPARKYCANRTNYTLSE